MSMNSIQFKLNQNDASANKVDALFVFQDKDQLLNPISIHPELDQEMRLLKDKNLFNGEVNEIQILPTYGTLPFSSVIYMGLGGLSETNPWREAGAKAAKAIIEYKLATVT